MASLNTLVLESKKISSELIVYFSMKIKNSDHPLYIFQIFFKIKFFRFLSKQIAFLVSLNTLVLESKNISSELIVYFSMKIKNSGHPLYIFFENRVSSFYLFALSRNSIAFFQPLLKINKNCLRASFVICKFSSLLHVKLEKYYLIHLLLSYLHGFSRVELFPCLSLSQVCNFGGYFKWLKSTETPSSPPLPTHFSSYSR